MNEESFTRLIGHNRFKIEASFFLSCNRQPVVPCKKCQHQHVAIEELKMVKLVKYIDALRTDFGQNTKRNCM